jgi:hypothetical protein
MAEKLTIFCTEKVAVSAVVRTGFDPLKIPIYCIRPAHTPSSLIA